MSELRCDPLSGTWALISDARGRRPQAFLPPQAVERGQSCPFCPGQEQHTAAEIYALRPDGSSANQSGWQVRVIPNQFPALRIEGELGNQAQGLYDRINAIGAHEIIIEHPDHQLDLGDLDPHQIAAVLQTWRIRLLDLRKDTRLRYLFVLKEQQVNGQQIHHSHSQLFALPLIPPLQQQLMDRCLKHFKRKERCLNCDLLHQELEQQERIICRNNAFVAYIPYASTHPFALRILPLEHRHDFGLEPENRLLQLGALLKEVLQRLRRALRNPPYQLQLQTSPPLQRPGYADLPAELPLALHWHLDLVPRLTRSHALQQACGISINPVAPETAARFLRDICA